ncbi:Na/Pi cotransporter family protein [Variovorax sp. DT-64]|uniref:Na/Pi cotransporter family protein n=1 Tax=Variovorax sp. DT-64 TaxID=3396160 RepID=UPI003F1AC203
MAQLLNLLAAIALLIWASGLMRSSLLKAFGTRLRYMLARAAGNRVTAAGSGFAITAVLQSSTATALIVSGFVGQRIMSLPLALALMLGADVGTSVMALIFSFDLSWMSPLFLLVGVPLCRAREGSTAGHVGKCLIGVGLMLWALHLIGASTSALTGSAVTRSLLASVSGDLLLLITVGAALTVSAYSSLAIVILTGTLAATGAISTLAGLGLVLGANLGSGLLAVMSSSRCSVEERRLPLGNLLFKVFGVVLFAPFTALWLNAAEASSLSRGTVVVGFHLAFNFAVALLCLCFTERFSAVIQILLRERSDAAQGGRQLRLHADSLALPSLAISCAAREAIHEADLVETMIRGSLRAIQENDSALARQMRAMDDEVDALCSGIKHYLTRLSRKTLSAEDDQRWTEITAFAINLEQVADIIERLLERIEKRNIAAGKQFSAAGLREIGELYALTLANLNLAMAVFIHRSPQDARNLACARRRYGERVKECSHAHLARLTDGTPESIETSSQHLDLISDLERVNFHVCAISSTFLDGEAPALFSLPPRSAACSP